MIVKRKYVNRRFTTIDTALLENKKLSLKAKGLIAYLLSRPEDWQIHMSQLSTICSDGETSIRSAMDELIETGYIVRTRRRNNDGRLNGFDYEVRDIVEFDQEAEKSAIQANQTINGFSTNGDSINGSSTNGDSINGSSTNGDSINGSSTNGNSINGKSRATYKENNKKDFKKNDFKKNVCVEKSETIQEEIHTHTYFEKNLPSPDEYPSATRTAKNTQPKVAQKGRQENSPAQTSFQESPYSSQEEFTLLLQKIGFESADDTHYFKKISATCKSRGTKSQDWEAYILLWLSDDQAAGKLKIVGTTGRQVQKTQTNTNQSEIAQKLNDLEDYMLSQKPKTKKWFELVLQSLEDMQKNKDINVGELERINALSNLINEIKDK